MTTSPKRYGMVMEEEDWFSTQLPRLTLSASSSNESIDRLLPPTPTLSPVPTEADADADADADVDAALLPSFHFSTTNIDADPAEFHRLAAQLLSGDASDCDRPARTWSSSSSRPTTSNAHLHCDLGRDRVGRFCCSCGKSFSTPFRLGQHMEECAGAGNHPCMTCDKVFSDLRKLSRHVSARHNDHREACPGCNIQFPAQYLPKHLASGLGGCGGAGRLSHSSSTPDIDDAYKYADSPSQQYWVFEGDHSWTPSVAKRNPHDSGYVPGDHERAMDQAMTCVTQLLVAPVSAPDCVPCGLCGEQFSTRGNALAAHIGRHSLDFTEKRHKCDECRIFFANEKDLDRHLQSANLTQHCGFTFRHNGACSGHHPPTYFKSTIVNDHDLMQKHLWSWELCQLRQNRVAVAQALARSLSQMPSPAHSHMTAEDCTRTYASLLPHLVAAHSDSPPDYAWMGEQADELSSLESQFTHIINTTYPDEAARADRPDSAVITGVLPHRSDSKRGSTRKSFIDLAKWNMKHTPKDAVKKAAHSQRRQALSTSGFALMKKQQHARDETRPQSLPTVSLTA
jgi:hypothetical protein